MAMLYPLIAVIIWAINAVINKLAVGVIDPAAISFYRWFFALLILTPFVLPLVIHNRQRIKPYCGQLAILGLLGMVLYQSLAYYSAQTVSALLIGIFISVIPLLTMLLSVFLLRTPPTLGMLIGGLLSLFGLLWLTSKGQPLQLLQLGVGKGELMMLAAATSYALYGVLMKRWVIPLPNWQSLYMQILFGVILLIPNFLLTSDVAITSDNLSLVLFAAIPASIVAPYAWIKGVMYLGASKSALFMNLTPVFTAIIAIVLLHEPLHSYHIIGGGIALLGVILAQNLNIAINRKTKA